MKDDLSDTGPVRWLLLLTIHYLPITARRKSQNPLPLPLASSPTRPLKPWSNPRYAFPQISTLSFYFLNTKCLPSLFSFWLNTTHLLKLCSSITSWLEAFSDCLHSFQPVCEACFFVAAFISAKRGISLLTCLSRPLCWEPSKAEVVSFLVDDITDYFYLLLFLTACFPSLSFNYINTACWERLKQYRSIK